MVLSTTSNLKGYLGTEPSDRCLMLFDLSIRGHHPSYIKQLILYWGQHQLPGRLHIVVSPRFLGEHADVVAMATHDVRQSVHFTAITESEEVALNSKKSPLTRLLRSLREWNLACQYAAQLRATAVVLMYFDPFQLPLALGLRSPCPVSGLYFRPTFHYGKFGVRPLSWRERLQQCREMLLIKRVLQHPDWQTLFCMDPLVVEQLERSSDRVTVVHLPDPIEYYPIDVERVQGLRHQLNIESDRQVFLLFGSLTSRKGVLQLLDAVAMLPSAQAEKLCLLLVGESNLRSQLEIKIAELSQSAPVQIIQHYEFVSDEVVPNYFQLADIVLAPYQRHVGMSGILLWAAMAGKPVLSSDYGLMGEMVRRYQLGVTVDSTVPSEIAVGLSNLLTQPFEAIGDRASMQQFAKQNAAENYAATIFNHLSEG